VMAHKTCALRAPRGWLSARTLFAVSFVLPFCYAARTSRGVAKGQWEAWGMPDARWSALTVHTFEGSCNSVVIFVLF